MTVQHTRTRGARGQRAGARRPRCSSRRRAAERRDDRDVRESRAKAICRECPVRASASTTRCASARSHGIWGGLNEHERRGLLEASYS